MKATALPSGASSALVTSSTWRQSALVLGATVLLAASAWVEIPLWPVPITLQSLAVAGVGLALGRRLATIAVLTYLFEGACGLPVFAGGASGVHVLAGPTGGYLLGFVLAAALAGAAADKGWVRGPGTRAAVIIAAHLVIFALGYVWLAGFVGARAALQLGVVPFLAGTVAKVVFGAVAPSVVSALGGARSRSAP